MKHILLAGAALAFALVACTATYAQTVGEVTVVAPLMPPGWDPAAPPPYQPPPIQGGQYSLFPGGPYVADWSWIIALINGYRQTQGMPLINTIDPEDGTPTYQEDPGNGSHWDPDSCTAWTCN